MTDLELAQAILEQHGDRITGAATRAFRQWIERETVLTEKQQKWLYGVAERCGLIVAPAENIFSSMSPEKQAEQRARAAKVKLPWEK
jgi:hypothetical protein